jgi:hypothetical protein
MKSRAITKLVSMIVAGAHALATGQAQATVGTPTPMESGELWSTIARIAQANPTAAVRIQLASVAGKTELTAALVQGLVTCSLPAVASCVKVAIARVGGLSRDNLVSLEALANALEAVGIASPMISRALDAYAAAVAEAVIRGLIPERFAALALADGAAGSLYL